MAKWKYELKFGKNLREAIDAGDVEATVKCLVACYRELQIRLSDEDKELIEFDIEDAIYNLENFDPEEDVDDYLECFYDVCDDIRVWIGI